MDMIGGDAVSEQGNTVGSRKIAQHVLVPVTIAGKFKQKTSSVAPMGQMIMRSGFKTTPRFGHLSLISEKNKNYHLYIKNRDKHCQGKVQKQILI